MLSPVSYFAIRHIRVSICPMRRAGSWGYFAGSWREGTSHVIIILEKITEKMEQCYSNGVFFINVNELGIRIMN